jgi:signal transduction histidine kinase
MFHPLEDIAAGKPERELEVALAEGRFEEEGWRVRKDGTRFWASVVITPVFGRQGELLGFAKVTRDLSELRRAREELRAAKRRSQELEVANLAKDEFLGTVAHELRTPLSILFGGTQLLARHYATIEAAEREELIESLRGEAAKMKDLVENLLALAQPASAIQLEPVPLGIHIQAVIEAFHRSWPERRVDFEQPGERRLVLVEPTLFERLLLNLLENAQKYDQSGEPITVRVAAEGAAVRISVLDRGPGVDAAELELIFTSFYRSPKQRAQARGKGLGLAVCRRLVELMGGTIEASARAGGGLHVSFTVPLATE